MLATSLSAVQLQMCLMPPVAFEAAMPLACRRANLSSPLNRSLPPVQVLLSVFVAAHHSCRTFPSNCLKQPVSLPLL